MAARPAAGPLTPTWEPLKLPTTIPPMIPAIKPEKRGAPLARAIPKQRGNATKNTTTLAGRSCFKFDNRFVFFILLFLYGKRASHLQYGFS